MPLPTPKKNKNWVYRLILPISMAYVLSLSQLLGLVQDVFDGQFAGQSFWVRCEVTDVKRYDTKNWCFCKLLEKKGGQVVAETPGVFWQQGYLHIRRFEKATGRKFEDGIEISALTLVKFHPKFGFKLEILEIDLNFSLGQMELSRQQTISRLLQETGGLIRQVEDLFFTPNNQLPLPQIIQRVALITANHSDGQRDFIQELTNNAQGYPFRITGYYTTIQGETAPGLMVKQFGQIAPKAHLYDVVVLVRGGGSQTDLKPFDDFELAKTIAFFPLPVLTGIGHDRNTSIADLMARQYKVPTKVAAAMVDHNLQAEQDLLIQKNKLEGLVARLLHDKKRQLDYYAKQLEWMLPNRIAIRRQRLEIWNKSLTLLGSRMLGNLSKKMKEQELGLNLSTARFIKRHKEKINMQARLVAQVDPGAILQKGFAIIEQDGKILTGLPQVDPKKTLVTKMANGQIKSRIEKIEKHDRQNDI